MGSQNWNDRQSFSYQDRFYRGIDGYHKIHLTVHTETKAKDPDGATLTCTADGARSRWVGGSAPAATKAAPATPAKAKTAKAPAAAKKAASSGVAGSAVKGRFCAKADDGKRDTNAKGDKLVCRADAAGKNRWQAA